jgi:hypothetical protein
MNVLLCFLFFFNTLFSENYQLTICSIFKNEAPYLKEWIEFHKLQGVEHFYLYNNQSSDHYLEVLSSYINSNEVTLIDWDFGYQPANEFTINTPWNVKQIQAYQDCIDRFRCETKWMAVIDLDEFLFCPTGMKLCDFLKRYDNYASLAVSWLCFGTSFIDELASDELVTENFIYCSNRSEDRDFFYKSIIQPSKIEKPLTAHGFLPKKGYFNVDSQKKIISNPIKNIDGKIDQVRINHYWTKDEKYLNEKKLKSRQERRSYQTARSFESFITKLNSKKDFAIQQFVPFLKEKLNK